MVKASELRSKSAEDLKVLFGELAKEIYELRNEFKVTRKIEKSHLIKEKMQPWMSFTTKRKTYHKGEFAIDIDETDFGYNVVEVEILAEDGEKAKEAEEKIINFAQSYGWEMKKLPGKGWEYLRRTDPELYLKLKDID